MISVRRATMAAIAAAGLLIALGAGLLLATSDHLVDPIAFGAPVAVIVVGWFSAALYWLVRRPGNRLGLYLLALAVAHAAVSLMGANQPELRTFGVLVDSVFLLLVFCVVFAFPEGRITSRFAWALLGAIALERLESNVPALLFSPVVNGNAPLGGCNASCPTNGFMIADRPDLADGFFSGDTSAYFLLAAYSAFFVYLIYQLATATRPRTRALLPVYVPALVAIFPVMVFFGELGRAGGLRCGPAPYGLDGHRRVQRTAVWISAFDRGEHVLRRDGVEKDRLPPGREPKGLSAARDAGRCTR